jgi:hypothetical protein
MVEEILHFLGGFIFGAGVYQYFFVKHGEKANLVFLFLAGFVGWVLVEFFLHGG